MIIRIQVVALRSAMTDQGVEPLDEVHVRHVRLHVVAAQLNGLLRTLLPLESFPEAFPKSLSDSVGDLRCQLFDRAGLEGRVCCREHGIHGARRLEPGVRLPLPLAMSTYQGLQEPQIGDVPDLATTTSDRARAIRSRGGEVRDIADLWFLETLVRTHREGEGEAYTGLEPAGSMNPVFAAADAALESGSVEELATEIADAVRQGLRERFGEALERQERAEESVELGRDYVEAYVTYMHFVERLDALVRHGGPERHDLDSDDHDAADTKEQQHGN